jgi:hypothetical protein
VQFGGDVEREVQAGQGPPLQVQVLLEDRHLVFRGAFGLVRIGQARAGHRLVHPAGALVFGLHGEGEELPAVRVEVLQQQGRGQRSLVPVGHPAALHRGPGTVTHRGVGEVGERVLADRGERQAAAVDVGPRDGFGPGAADRGRVDERQVRLVEEVVDEDRRVGRHPEDGQEHRGDVAAAGRHARMQVREASARGIRGEPHHAVPLGGLGRAAQRGPRRDRRGITQRRDVHATAVSGEPPPVIRALQRAAGDLPRGQPRPAVRARVGERRDDAAEAGQRPPLTGQTDRDGLLADFGGQCHRMPELRERRMRVGELPRCHILIVAHSRGRWVCQYGDSCRYPAGDGRIPALSTGGSQTTQKSRLGGYAAG